MVRQWRELSLSIFRMVRESSMDQLKVVLMEGEGLRSTGEEDFNFNNNNVG